MREVMPPFHCIENNYLFIRFWKAGILFVHMMHVLGEQNKCRPRFFRRKWMLAWFAFLLPLVAHKLLLTDKTLFPAAEELHFNLFFYRGGGRNKIMPAFCSSAGHRPIDHWTWASILVRPFLSPVFGQGVWEKNTDAKAASSKPSHFFCWEPDTSQNLTIIYLIYYC